jgi:pimeloyl-ACP methyl ester carboxylesterase
MRWPRWLGKATADRLHVAIDSGRGPVVILVHGIASSSTTFFNLVPRLRAYHVIAIDLLGFGKSAAPANARFTIEEHVEALDRTIDGLRLDRKFVLVGHSMGALIAARYASEHSRNLDGLVLISLPIYLDPENVANPTERLAMRLYRMAFESLRGNKARTILDAAILGSFSPIKNALQLNDDNWHAFDLSLVNTIETQTVVGDIANTTTPIHILYGGLDPLMVPHQLQLLGRMRHVTLTRVPTGDHLIRGELAAQAVQAIAALSGRTQD